MKRHNDPLYMVGADEILPNDVFAEQNLTKLRWISSNLWDKLIGLYSENAELQSQISTLHANISQKEDFVGMVLHELQNPLTALLLSSTRIQQQWHKMSLDDVHLSLESMKIASLRMRDILHQLLELHSLESGRRIAIIQEINVENIIESLAEQYREYATAKNITISIHSFVLEMRMLGDERMIIDILENLLTNAIKYSPLSGSIDVHIIPSRYTAQPPQPSIDTEVPSEEIEMFRFIRVEISDEGVGLTDSDKEYLFTKFGKLSPRPTAKEHSTGLGLYIAKKLTEIMHGKIWCKSTLGQGSTFIVEFPIVV